MQAPSQNQRAHAVPDPTAIALNPEQAAMARALVESSTLPAWPEPATRRLVADIRACRPLDHAAALLILEEWHRYPAGTAARWMADPAVKAAMARGEVLFFPSPIGAFYGPALTQAIAHVDRMPPFEAGELVQESMEACDLLPPWLQSRLGCRPHVPEVEA